MTKQLIPIELNNEIDNFNGMQDRLDKYRETTKIIPQTDTAEGLQECRIIRKNGVTLRGEIKKAQQMINGTLKNTMSGVKSVSDSLQAEIVELYAPHDTAIKEAEAEAAKRKAERDAKKAEEARLEIARIDSIKGMIESINRNVINAAGKSSEKIRACLAHLDNMTVTAEIFQEFTATAIAAKADTTLRIRDMLTERERLDDVALRQADEEKRLAEQRAELQAKMDEMEALRKVKDDALKAEESERLAKIEAERRVVRRKKIIFFMELVPWW